MCIVWNLAYAEMFIALATLFRRHHFETLSHDKGAMSNFYMENLKASSPWPGESGGGAGLWSRANELELS